MRCKDCGLVLVKGAICPDCGRKPGIEALVKSDDSQDRVILSRWLSVLLWLSIPSVIGSLMSNFIVPTLALVGAAVLGMVFLINGLALYILSRQESKYRKAFICYLFGFVAALFAVWIPIVSIVALGVSLLAMYFEYDAHAYLLESHNPAISDSWKKLWRWTIGIYIGTIVFALFEIVVPMLGVMFLSLGLVGLFIANIERIVLLSATVKSFK